jgi:polar amino acid transport system substrate-binding protein
MMIRSGLSRPLRAIKHALPICLAMSALGTLSANSGPESAQLAPTGHLRVGVYPGSPTSMVVDPVTEESHGLAHDLGQEFARRLNVPRDTSRLRVSPTSSTPSRRVTSISR